MPKAADLLDEIATLKALLAASEARSSRKDERIERLEKLVAAFRQAAFGRRSEKGDPDQFELALEDLETAIAAIHAEEDAEDRALRRPARPRAANRGSLPKHLPRIEEVIAPESLTCACGGCLHCIGEDGEPLSAIGPRTMASERLDPPRANSPLDCLPILVDPCPVPCDRDPPPQICLPVLHRRRGAGSDPGTADPGRDADRGDGRACAGLEIRRSSSFCDRAGLVKRPSSRSLLLSVVGRPPQDADYGGSGGS